MKIFKSKEKDTIITKQIEIQIHYNKINVKNTNYALLLFNICFA